MKVFIMGLCCYVILRGINMLDCLYVTTRKKLQFYNLVRIFNCSRLISNQYFQLHGLVKNVQVLMLGASHMSSFLHIYRYKNIYIK